MSTIYELVEDVLDGLSMDYAANVYIPATGDALPDTYAVYQVIATPPEQHADNAETLRSYLVQVTIYARGGLVGLPDVRSAMVAAGFMRAGQRDINYNADTRHFGQSTDYVYLEEAT